MSGPERGVERASAGPPPPAGPERAAFEILIREHADLLLAYLRSICPDGDLVEEAFQQTVIDAWQTLATFDRTRPFAPWLRGVARNRLLVLIRARGRLRRRHEEFERIVGLRFDSLDGLRGESFGERLVALRDCLERLPAGQREAIELVYGREQDTHTAARILGLDWETLRKRVQRARMSLADCLRNKGVFSESSP